MGYQTRTTCVMHVPVPDPGSYSWLVSGLCERLIGIDQLVRKPRAPAALQVAGLLETMSAALSVIGDCALRAIFDHMRAAWLARPALATAMTPKQSLAVRHFIYACMAHLDTLRSGAHTPVLYLYPYYAEMMSALGVVDTHPADLYYAQSRSRIDLIEKDFLAEMRPARKADYALLKSDFEKAFRLYMQHSGVASKERDHIVVMHSLLEHVVDAQESTEGRAFWGVVLGFSEVVVSKAVGNDQYVRQLYRQIADYLRTSTTATIVLPKTILLHALFFIAHVKGEEESVVEKIKVLYKMPEVAAPDYKQARYMAVDPVVLASLKDRISQLQSMWNSVTDGIPNYEKSFANAVNGLKDQGELLGSADMAELFNVLRRNALPVIRNKSEHSVKLEVTRNLLFIEAALYTIDKWPAQFTQMVQDATLRLVSSLSRKYVDEPLASQKKLVADEHYDRTTMMVADEILAQLQQLAPLLQQLLLSPGDRRVLHQTTLLLDNLDSIFLMLDYQAANRALSHAKRMISMMYDDVFDRKKLWCIMNNMAVLGFFTGEIRNRAFIEENALHFEEATGMLMRRASKGADHPWQPHPDNFALHCTALLAHSHIAEQMYLEEDDSVLEKQPLAIDNLQDGFLYELDAIVQDIDSILPLSRLMPDDMGHIEALHDVFHALEQKSRMAGELALSEAALNITHALNHWIADNKPGSPALYALLAHAHELMGVWLEDMRVQGQSGKRFTMLAVAANSLMNGTPILKSGMQ